MEQELWDVAADMAVENAILSLGISGIDVIGDRERRETLAMWRKKAGALTAERIYRNLKSDRLGATELLELGNLFRRDIHESWDAAENVETLEITQEQWKKLSERIKAELKSFRRTNRTIRVFCKILRRRQRKLTITAIFCGGSVCRVRIFKSMMMNLTMCITHTDFPCMGICRS